MRVPVEYTFRYLAADGAFRHVVHARCDDDADALRKATNGTDQEYAALEIKAGDRIVWRGLRDDAMAAARRDH